jgi:predicted lipoprotein
MQKKVIKYALSIVALLVIAYNSVYFKSLDEVKAASAVKQFDAASYVRNFFDKKLMPGIDKAIEIDTLLKLLKSDPAKTFQTYSNALGIGNIRYFLVKGEGTIKAIDENTTTIYYTSGNAQKQLDIATEFVYGNAIRDASGLININEFNSTMDFNNVSAEINKIVRTEVLPSFKEKGKVGDSVIFSGAIELTLGLAWHPNVVEVYEDGYLPDGTCYLVMERLHGESLANRLHRVGPLPPSTLLPLALQMCDALGAVHAAGIVHRDIKPSNIFLELLRGERGEEGDHVKLLDFGVARVEWAETRLTNANSPLGTRGYMSPEQEQGLEIDHRSDIFALGAVLYECLTGELPPLSPASLWTGERGADSGVHRASVDMPQAWRALIQRAMSPLPQQRFADSRGMREALVQLGRDGSRSVSA